MIDDTPRGLAFPAFSRVLHWLMAIMIFSMLLIGIGMVASASHKYATLVSIHKPLGIAILLLVIVRFVNRLINRPPPLPVDLPEIQKLAAHASHILLYLLMFLMPIIGWAMLSAGGYPIVLVGSLQLPPILPQSDSTYALLRSAHTLLAFALFALVLMHLAAALFHALVRRDGVFESMTYRARRK